MAWQKRKLKGLLVFLTLLFSLGVILTGAVKTVYIPEDIEVEENATREIRVRNLSEQEIFTIGYFHFFDNFMYYKHRKPLELIKLDLQGSVVKRLMKIGEGPGEYVNIMGFREYMGGIAFLDSVKMKLLIYTKDFKFSRETRMKVIFQDFFVNKRNEIVFYQASGHSDYYFHVYSKNAVKPLRKFGKTITSFADYQKKRDFDSVRHVLYLPGKDGVWTSFRNRYDLRYYEKEKLSAEIRGPKGFFEGIEQDMMGRKYINYQDRATHLARVNNHLFYLYSKGKSTFCDIFDMDSLTLLRRIRFKKNYWYCLSHWNDNIFYGAINDVESEDEDLILYRIELKNPQFKNMSDKTKNRR